MDDFGGGCGGGCDFSGGSDFSGGGMNASCGGMDFSGAGMSFGGEGMDLSSGDGIPMDTLGGECGGGGMDYYGGGIPMGHFGGGMSHGGGFSGSEVIGNELPSTTENERTAGVSYVNQHLSTSHGSPLRMVGGLIVCVGFFLVFYFVIKDWWQS